jgi:hypothetical protein
MEQGKPYLEVMDSGERTPIAARKTAAIWDGGPHRLTSQYGQEQPVRSEADIPRVLGPPPTAQSLLDGGLYDPLRLLRRELGDRAYIATPAHGVFPIAINAMGGFEEGMIALRERPHLFRAVVEQIALHRSVRLEAAASLGADAAWIGGYLEGADLVSPQVWREVALPGHRIQVQAARANGLQVLFWFLGDCMPLLRDLAELGIDGLVVEQPRRGYSSDPVRVRQEIGSAFCVYGWNWELDFIRDRRERITGEVERQIRGAGLDGAFIMGTTYLTSEASLGAVDHFCREVVRVSREAGY